MSRAGHRVVQLRKPLTEDERLSLVEQSVLCHPAVHSVEIEVDGDIHAEVVLWHRSPREQVVRDLEAALGTMAGGVRLTVTAVAHRRRGRVLLALV
ncbi:hypothetical protein [Lentzea sp.]|uniref:hypothetical protein n=1 Tax=Lentzea sp. TaxID=56099 RepID=UPI002B68EE4B|nr:hypothetical protein [Lentzea sp.]HUQ55000.1 hypothetical protein [Lentzea sp.]